MPRRLAILAFVTALTFSACSTEEQIAADARAERLAAMEEDRSSPQVLEPEKPRVEQIALRIQERLENYSANKGRLPYDVDNVAGEYTFRTSIRNASWDAENYNLCIVDYREDKIAIIQSELSSQVRVVPGVKGCDSLAPTKAEAVYDAVNSGSAEILSPIGARLPIGGKNFQAKLDKVLENPRFGTPMPQPNSGEILTFEAAEWGFERVGKIGLAYSCVTFEGLSKMRFEKYGNGVFITSDLFVDPDRCDEAELREAARSWWGVENQ